MAKTSARLTRQPSEKEITDLDLAILVGATGDVPIGGITMYVRGATDPENKTLLAKMRGNGYGVPQRVRDILTGRGYVCCYSARDNTWEIHWNRDSEVNRRARIHYFMGRR